MIYLLVNIKINENKIKAAIYFYSLMYATKKMIYLDVSNLLPMTQ